MKTPWLFLVCMLVMIAFVPSAEARLIPCHDPSVNYKPACAYFDAVSHDYKGDCYSYFMHDPVFNDESWVYCDWE